MNHAFVPPIPAVMPDGWDLTRYGISRKKAKPGSTTGNKNRPWLNRKQAAK